MKEERLKELLDRYYRGESSEAEEAELREYFSGEIIPEDFDAEREIFRYYSASEIIPVPSEGFTERIIREVDELNEGRKRVFSRKRILAILSVAATVLILIGSYFIFFSREDIEDTFTDPRIAYTETIKILNEVSIKFNKGTMALQPLGKIQFASETGIETVDRSAELISRNLKKIKLLEQVSATGGNLDEKNQK